MPAWIGTTVAALLLLWTTSAAAQLYPSVRGEPGPAPGGGAPTDLGGPRVPTVGELRSGRAEIPDRATTRGEAGTAVGTADPGRTGRPIARSSAGEAVGTVDPARSGGGVVRAPDGTAEGLVPAGPSARGMGAQRR